MTDGNVVPDRRYSEAGVILHKGGQVLRGIQFYHYPVDYPPVVEAPDVARTWYRSVWEDRGWKVYDGD